MAVGQEALRGGWDIAALDAVETRLEVRAVEQCCAHAGLLPEVLELHRLHLTADSALSTVPQLGLLLQVSEGVDRALLAEARLLSSLPGGLEAVECGLLTVPQSAALLRAVGESDDAVRLVVWRRLQARLLAALDEGSVLPPARLASLLTGWVIAADPATAEARRTSAEAGGDVSYRRRADGLGDLFATAVPGPLLQAVLCRIRQASRPFGAADERSAGKRRLDALVNLVPGREQLHLDADLPAAEPTSTARIWPPTRPPSQTSAVTGLAAEAAAAPAPAPARRAAAGWTRRCRAVRRWWCTSRSAPPSARPTSWPSWSGTDRCTSTSCTRCCATPRS